MNHHSRGAVNPTGSSTSSALGWDAKILQDALRDAVSISPDSFLKTVEDIDAKLLEYWIDEIRSSTWAVVQRDEEVVGIVAGKCPDSDNDPEDQTTTRYIESVWIAPDLRGQGLAQRLINYLMEVEYRRNERLRHFLLWVFETNLSAIGLYEHMGFVRTRETKTLQKIDGARTEIEIKYRLDFDREVYTAVRLAVNEAARRQDERQYGVTYRVLGEKDSL